MSQERRDKAILEREGVMRYTATILNPNIGHRVKKIWAKRVNNHFVLYDECLVSEGQGMPNTFDVLCKMTPQEVERRLYQRAREFLGNCDIDDKTGYSLRDTVV